MLSLAYCRADCADSFLLQRCLLLCQVFLHCWFCICVFAGQGPGIPNVDYILYVSSANCQAGTVAYAGVCAVGGEDNRPIMGSINLCPGAFDRLSYKRQIEVITHELLHAFAFSPSLFALYVNGDPRSKIKTPYGEVTAIVSPRVQQETRRMFGCDSAQGALLEDEGNSGSTGSHWETRLFEGELMLASASFAGEHRDLSRWGWGCSLWPTGVFSLCRHWWLPRIQKRYYCCHFPSIVIFPSACKVAL